MSDHAREILPGVWRIDALHPAPAQTCCYLLAEKDEAALIDCGAQKSIQPILDAVAAAQLRPEQVRYIIPTHAHLDHSGAAGNLMQHFPNAELAAHPSTVKHLVNPHDRLLPAVRALYGDVFFDEEYAGMIAAPQERTRPVQDGEKITVGGMALQMLYTPGHAWNHVSAYVPARGVVFSGDAFGISHPETAPEDGDDFFIVPVMPPTQFSPEAARESLLKFRALNAEYAALAHFGAVRCSAAAANKQLAALEEWQEAAQKISANCKNGAAQKFYPEFLSYLQEWYKKESAAADPAAMLRRHKTDLHLTACGFEHWTGNKNY